MPCKDTGFKKNHAFNYTPLAYNVKPNYDTNVVGYQKISISSGLNLVGSQFCELQQVDKDIQQMFLAAGNTLPGYGVDFESHTKLLVYEDGGYTTYEWSADGEGTAIGDSTQDAKWLTQGGAAVATANIPVGYGFWISTDQAANVTVVGEVKTANTAEITVSSGLTLLSNPYPEAVNIQDIVPSNTIPGYGTGFESSTKLLVYEDGGYTTYEWSADGEGTAIGDPTQDAKWLTQGGAAVATSTIPVGEGFWISTTGSGSLTFTK